ncbi:MAG: hypothetical protein ACKVWR_10250 [Acidimicrobiales bacterium]
MGQPVTVIEKQTANPKVRRYEINRNLTGMGHERYTAGRPIEGARPADELARRLFARGGVDAVHVYNNMITVDLSSSDTDGIQEIIENLFIYYRPGVEVPVFEG